MKLAAKVGPLVGAKVQREYAPGCGAAGAVGRRGFLGGDALGDAKEGRVPARRHEVVCEADYALDVRGPGKHGRIQVIGHAHGGVGGEQRPPRPEQLAVDRLERNLCGGDDRAGISVDHTLVRSRIAHRVFPHCQTAERHADLVDEQGDVLRIACAAGP